MNEEEKFIFIEKEKKRLEELEQERKVYKQLLELLQPKIEIKINPGPPPKAPNLPVVLNKKEDKKDEKKKALKVIDEKKLEEAKKKKEEGLKKKEEELKKKQEEEIKKKLEKKDEIESDESMLFAEFFTNETFDNSGEGIDMSKWLTQDDPDSDDMGDEWIEPKDLEEKRSRYKCKKFYTLSDTIAWNEAGKSHKNSYPDFRIFEYNPEINKKISIWNGNATTIELDAIVNAANTSLLGGGGIDGAIHKNSGRFLKKECRKLEGCKTGYTKITKGYKLPSKYVLHTVGPTNGDDELLKSCYETTLELVKEYGIKTVGLCCVSTGIFGYPLREATLVAFNTVRKWLEKNKDIVDRIIFITYLPEETKEYELLCPYFFPLKLE